jgi:UDP-N-acetylglucosamine:LPS N-acetylglucosamine transferase
MSWRDDPITEKQAQFLIKHDVCTMVEALTLTKGKASDLISAVIDDNRDALDAALEAAFPEDTEHE